MAKQDPAIRRQKMKEWRTAHREELKTYNAKYRLEHLEAISARETERCRTPEFRARSVARYAANPQKFRAYATKYRETHREQIKASVRANPDKARAYCLRRRARKNGAAINDLTAEQWQEIKAAYGYRCVYCGRKVQRLTQDHIIPLSKGGNHTVQNVVPACSSCNKRKHTGPPPVQVQPLLFTMAPPKE